MDLNIVVMLRCEYKKLQLKHTHQPHLPIAHFPLLLRCIFTSAINSSVRPKPFKKPFIKSGIKKCLPINGVSVVMSKPAISSTNADLGIKLRFILFELIGNILQPLLQSVQFIFIFFKGTRAHHKPHDSHIYDKRSVRAYKPQGVLIGWLVHIQQPAN